MEGSLDSRHRSSKMYLRQIVGLAEHVLAYLDSALPKDPEGVSPPRMTSTPMTYQQGPAPWTMPESPGQRYIVQSAPVGNIGLPRPLVPPFGIMPPGGASPSLYQAQIRPTMETIQPVPTASNYGNGHLPTYPMPMIPRGTVIMPQTEPQRILPFPHSLAGLTPYRPSGVTSVISNQTVTSQIKSTTVQTPRSIRPKAVNPSRLSAKIGGDTNKKRKTREPDTVNSAQKEKEDTASLIILEVVPGSSKKTRVDDDSASDSDSVHSLAGSESKDENINVLDVTKELEIDDESIEKKSPSPRPITPIQVKDYQKWQELIDKCQDYLQNYDYTSEALVTFINSHPAATSQTITSIAAKGAENIDEKDREFLMKFHESIRSRLRI